MKNNHPFEALDSVSLNKEITAIGKVGAKLNTRIQTAALNCLHYVNVHGDTGYANRLVAALSAGIRKAALVTFLTKYGKLEYSKELKTLVYNKAALVVESIDDIKENWYECKAEKVIAESIDLEVEVVAFIKRMTKRIADTPQVLNGGLIDMVQLALDQYREEQIAEDVATTQEIATLMQGINQRKAA